MKTRRPLSAAFKTKVVLEALKEQSTISALAQKYEVQAGQILAWKKQFLENVSSAFEKESKIEREKEKEIADLYEQIGRLNVQCEFLKKNLLCYCKLNFN